MELTEMMTWIFKQDHILLLLCKHCIVNNDLVNVLTVCKQWCHIVYKLQAINSALFQPYYRRFLVRSKQNLSCMSYNPVQVQPGNWAGAGIIMNLPIKVKPECVYLVSYLDEPFNPLNQSESYKIASMVSTWNNLHKNGYAPPPIYNLTWENLILLIIETTPDVMTFLETQNKSIFNKKTNDCNIFGRRNRPYKATFPWIPASQMRTIQGVNNMVYCHAISCDHYCSLSANLAKRCSQCKHVWYCSSNCQKLDWSRHSKICKIIKTC
jgi:hypothetical protein